LRPVHRTEASEAGVRRPCGRQRQYGWPDGDVQGQSRRCKGQGTLPRPTRRAVAPGAGICARALRWQGGAEGGGGPARPARHPEGEDLSMKPRAVVLGCLIAACGGARAPLPSYFTAVQAGHPSYPEARFIDGVGLSSASPADAETRARENVTLRISTRLESETSSFQRFPTQTGTTEPVPSRVWV